MWSLLCQAFTTPALIHTLPQPRAQSSEPACIYSSLILNDGVTALANVNIGSLICNVGAGGPAPAAGAAPAGGPAPTTPAPAEEKKVEAKKEESEESHDDMAFGLFD
ncbi:PREDICTED: 60S acidic ribosomal protein P1-like [Miniopterus natalensis]|uniref:60S acidic ribosomal protein P1-like n=1 Tax=Miniopterus natalensis TaxID=291302 RepID=UPI0007A70838|nr:PREDICTED: 60S acidic ribosomal protein P1-like [Miniopterus natalensis]